MAIRWVGAAAAAAVAARVARSRRRRFLHPAGRSFEAEITLAGLGLTAVTGRHRATVRVSKGAGTRGARLDVRGLAIRVHLPERDLDLLLSTSGTGPLSRHLPAPRRTFDTFYGSITAYRAAGRKVYLTGTGTGAGRSLADLTAGDRFRLGMLLDGTDLPLGEVRLGRALPPDEDAVLAYNPVLNSLPELHPVGLVHGVRAFTYRAGQRWRGVPSFERGRQGAPRTGSGHRREEDVMPGREDMPSTLRRSSAKAQETYVKTHDSAVEQYGEGERAHRTAFAAVKHSFEKVGDHWEPKGEKGPSDAKAAGGRGTRAETAGGVDANASKEHLLALAKRLDIPGRSRMTKAELVEALQKANDRSTRTAREK